MKALKVVAVVAGLVAVGYAVAPAPLQRDLKSIGRDLRKVFIK